MSFWSLKLQIFKRPGGAPLRTADDNRTIKPNAIQLLVLAYQLNMKLKRAQTIESPPLWRGKHSFVYVSQWMHRFIFSWSIQKQRGKEQCLAHNHNVFHKCKIRVAESSYAHYQVITERQNTVTVRDDIALSLEHPPKEKGRKGVKEWP